MITNSPCGMIVDFARYTGRMPVHPFRDTDAIEHVDWYFTNPGAKTCPYPNCIYWRNWDMDEINADGTAMNPDGPVSYIKIPRKPFAPGTQVCGTEKDFTEGCLAFPQPPVFPLRPDGLPICCGIQFAFGAAHLQLEGLSAWSYVPPAIAPSGACTTATTPPMDAPQFVTLPPFVVGWYKFPILAGQQYYVKLISSTGGFNVMVLEGTSCASLTSRGFWATLTCNSFNALATGNVYVNVSHPLFGTAHGTIEMGLGACPP